ncbi:MAG: precorrin-2 C(20)-methyltransferase [Tissierellia bacterium]|nr:precorrin-2 C(20)-methyltransferase [Tissierellia bacterium]
MERTLYGIGTGPGASDLLTVRAVNIIKDADIIFAPNNRGKNMALNSASPYIEDDKKIVKVDFPMGETTSKDYKKAMETIDHTLKPGMKGVYLNIGDNTIYSTFMNMVQVYCPKDLKIELIPGIPSFVAAANIIEKNITLKDENFLLCDNLENVPLDHIDSIAILKTSIELEKTLDRLDEYNFKYYYISKATFPEEIILSNREEILKENNYMSLILARKESI